MTQPRHSLLIFAVAVATALALAATDAAAQKRYGGNTSRDSSQTSQQHEAAAGPEPFSALERELASLNVDLLLAAGQVELWRAFERDVRDLADMGRAQSRYLQGLREGAESAPNAVVFIAALAEDERTKNEALLDLRHHLDALYAALDNTQKRTLDRRVLRSQTEAPAR
jgi:hypothetical protein